MLVKNKKLDKALKIYLDIYYFFSFVCVNITLYMFLDNYNLANSFTGFIILIITMLSSAAVEFRIEKEAKEDKHENKG